MISGPNSTQANWLSDISWSVSGLAIRRAMEFQLARSDDLIVGDDTASGRSGSRLLLSNPDDALCCLRMWYLFFICDRHLSILYGRPSTFGDEVSVVKWQRYLDAISETSTDVRLASQIKLLLILDEVIALFGIISAVRIPVSFQSRLEGFNHQLDRWIITWGSRYEPHEQIGDFPAKALTLHYHFAKLFVSSHVFRGHSSHAGENPLPAEYHDIAQVAIKSAKGIVDLITQDLDIRAGFVAMPHYYHTMIAYACSFLLRLASNNHNHLGIEQQDILNSILQVTELCQSTQCTRYHIIHWMGSGLREIAENHKQAMVNQSSNYANHDEQVLEEGIDEDPESSTRRPDQELHVDLWDAVRQAATTHGHFLGGEPVPTDERTMTGDRMFVPDMASIGLGSQWEALLASFGG
ncbi:hypothetical protein BHE90_006065 [Fusarium euwallaceae]|uniref:Xylanolytic transcriptional activator regulatory domain-containing protein n=1 Tax=Fusarium euwallaceae TaxID=1147111 RepID=A0A430LUQ3_9HYPO|nr:hypothetical protein BHE90_006065 [Fusarium euwallaceae]